MLQKYWVYSLTYHSHKKTVIIGSAEYTPWNPYISIVIRDSEYTSWLTPLSNRTVVIRERIAVHPPYWCVGFDPRRREATVGDGKDAHNCDRQWLLCNQKVTDCSCFLVHREVVKAVINAHQQWTGGTVGALAGQQNPQTSRDCAEPSTLLKILYIPTRNRGRQLCIRQVGWSITTSTSSCCLHASNPLSTMRHPDHHHRFIDLESEPSQKDRNKQWQWLGWTGSGAAKTSSLLRNTICSP